MSEKSFIPEPFSEVEKQRMLKDARRNEERQRAMTSGDASLDTQEIFDEKAVWEDSIEPKEGETKVIPKKTPEAWKEEWKKSAGISDEGDNTVDKERMEAIRKRLEDLEPGSTTKRPY